MASLISPSVALASAATIASSNKLPSPVSAHKVMAASADTTLLSSLCDFTFGCRQFVALLQQYCHLQNGYIVVVFS